MRRRWGTCFIATIVAAIAVHADAAPSLDLSPGPTATRPVDRRAVAVRESLPLSFETNRGQAPADYDFLVRCRGYVAFVAPTDVTFSFDGAPLRLSLDGAARCEPQTRGLELSGHVNYFVGNDPSKWLSDVPISRGAEYRDVAPGTTWRFGGRGHALEFSFDLSPSADPPRLHLDGALGARVADDGSLRIAMPDGEATVSAPSAWQDVPGSRLAAEARWVVEKDGAVRIAVSTRDATRGVHIDPTVTYETYLGGSQGDQCTDAAMDSSGNAYLSGLTDSSNFPVTFGAFSRVRWGSTDGFVTKISASGSSLVYSTYLGGSGNTDYMTCIAVDAAGNAYAGGYASSSDYPTTVGVYKTAPNTSGGGGVVTELNAAGSGLVFSSYCQAGPGGIAFGPSGSFYLCDSNGIARYSAGCASLVFYKQLMPTGPLPNGGFEVTAVATDRSGDAYVAGDTSYGWMATTGAFQTSITGSNDAIVVKVDSGGSIVYWTYLGGSSGDPAYAIDVNYAGQAYVAGLTQSSNFPVTTGAYKTTITASGNDEAYVARLDALGSGLRYATYLGSGTANSIRVHPGSSYVVGGLTQNANFPVSGAFQSGYGGNTDAFILKFNRDNTLAWSSFCGGSNSDQVTGLGMAPDGTVVAGGITSSTDFPTASPYQSAAAGGYESFAIVIPDTLPLVTPLGVTATTLPTWTVSYPYASQQLQLSGGIPSYTWTVASGSLPTGVVLTSTGLVGGTPTQTGTFTFKARVEDVCEMAAERQFTLQINPPPSITSASLADVTIGTACDRPIPVRDGSGVFTYAVTNGVPPAGLLLSADGHMQGTPTVAGDSAFTVLVTDGLGATGSRPMTMHVNLRPVISTASIPPCTETRPYVVQFQGGSGSGALTWSVSAGSLPTVTPIDAALGRISGSAKAAAAYPFTVRVTDAAGATTDRDFIATVNPYPQITTTTLPDAAIGRPYLVVVRRTGGTAPFAWGLDSGALPQGLSIDPATGALTGTPLAEAAGGVSLNCRDACGAEVSHPFTLGAATGVDLTKKKAGETLKFVLDDASVARRWFEVTAGALLSVSATGGGAAGESPVLHLFDAAGNELDVLQETRTTKKSVAIRKFPIPATGRYFLTFEAAAKFAGKVKLSIAITPPAAFGGGVTVGPDAPFEAAFAAPPGARLSITSRATKHSAALPKIVSILAADGTDVLAGGVVKEKGGSATFGSKTPLAGGDYRVVFSTRDANVGSIAWSIRLQMPRKYEFALPDLPAGQ
jgi:hypothetical protein